MNEEVIENLSLHLAFEGYDDDFIHHLVYEIGLDKETQHCDLESIRMYSEVYKHIIDFRKDKQVDTSRSIITLEFSERDLAFHRNIEDVGIFYIRNFNLTEADFMIQRIGPSLIGLHSLHGLNHFQMVFIIRE